MHRHGSLVVAQLNHYGGQATVGCRAGSVGALTFPEVNTGEVPKAMEEEDIRGRGWVRRVRRQVMCLGADGVEITPASIPFCASFVPFTNFRTDAWAS